MTDAALRLEWTDALRSRVLPFRGEGKPKRARAVDLANLYAKPLEAYRNEPTSYAPEHGPLPDLQRRVIARWEGAVPEGLDLELEAAVLVLSRVATSRYFAGSVSERLVTRTVDELAARASIPDAMRSLCAAGRLGADTVRGVGSEYGWAMVLTRDAAKGYLHPARDLEGWLALRSWLAHASDEDYDACVAIAEAEVARSEALRIALSLALPDATQLFAGVADRPREARSWHARAHLLSCVRDLDEARALLKGSPPIDVVRLHLLSIPHIFGLEGYPLLEKKAPGARPYADYVRSWVTAMSVYVGPRPARRLADQLETKTARAAVGAYFERHPELAADALAPLAKAKKKALRETAATLLRAAERALAEPGTLADLAPVSALPEVLRDPPWRRRGKRPKPPVVELEPSALPVELGFAEDEVRRARERRARWHGHGRHVEQARAAARGERAGTLWSILELDDDEAVDCLTRTSTWTGAWTEQVRQIAQCLGEPAIAPLAAIVEDHAGAVEGLADVGAASIARPMLAAFRRRKLRPIAQRWMLRFPEHAIAGLLPVALGSDDRARALAEQALGYLLSKGHRDAILARAGAHGESALAATRAWLERDPILDAPAKPKKRPGWLVLDHLPPPTTREGLALPPDAVRHLVEMLHFSPPDPPYAGLAAVREACDPASLDAFAVALCEAWVASGAPSGAAWAAHAVGHLGGDAATRWMATKLDAWLREKSKARAQIALEVLSMIGTDLALMHVARRARSGTRQWLKAAAAEVLDDVAAERGLSPDELEDRTAPDLGLDASGSLTLDYGPRRYRVRFDEGLRPSLIDEAGALVPRIPSVRKTDDAEKAKAAKRAWKALKSDAEKIARSQIERLERAMATGRGWSLADFRAFLVDHPLVRHLTQRLICGAFVDGELRACFRVAEDGTFADIEDDEWRAPRRRDDRHRAPARARGRRGGSLGPGARRLRDHPALPAARAADVPPDGRGARRGHHESLGGRARLHGPPARPQATRLSARRRRRLRELGEARAAGRARVLDRLRAGVRSGATGDGGARARSAAPARRRPLRRARPDRLQRAGLRPRVAAGVTPRQGATGSRARRRTRRTRRSRGS